jgi:hypothetical protein
MPEVIDRGAHAMAFAERDTDHVSKFIRALAIGLMLLGFAVLDQYQLLPQLPVASAVANPA